MNDWVLARGYRYAGVHCGIRPDPARRDLALVVSDMPAAAAGMFTRNRVAGVRPSRSLGTAAAPDARGVVICSGNANACTGPEGLADARPMAAVPPRLSAAARADARLLHRRHRPASAHAKGSNPASAPPDATRCRLGCVRQRGPRHSDHRYAHQGGDANRLLAGGDVRLTGVAKGAAMIGPNMATMLAFSSVTPRSSARTSGDWLRRAADRSFNCISVEGHTSTNDTVLLFANGAGPRLAGSSLERFEERVTQVYTEVGGDRRGCGRRDAL